jgi:hypothetical protein
MFKFKYTHLLIFIFMILLLCFLLFNNCNCNDVCDKYNKFTVGVPCTFGVDAGADAVAGDAEEAIVDEVVVEPEGPPEEPLPEEPVADEPVAEEEAAGEQATACRTEKEEVTGLFSSFKRAEAIKTKFETGTSGSCDPTMGPEGWIAHVPGTDCTKQYFDMAGDLQTWVDASRSSPSRSDPEYRAIIMASDAAWTAYEAAKAAADVTCGTSINCRWPEIEFGSLDRKAAFLTGTGHCLCGQPQPMAPGCS